VALNCVGEVAYEPIPRLMTQTVTESMLDNSFSPFLGLQSARPSTSFVQGGQNKLTEHLNRLSTLKQQAVDSENYEQASQLKAVIA
jgi:UvrB/uvrC motif